MLAVAILQVVSGRNDKGSPWFAARIQDSVTMMTAAHLPAADDLVATILGGMFLQTVTWWLANDRPLTSDELAVRYARLASAIIRDTDSASSAFQPPNPVACTPASEGQ
ncbi:hypothetical protein [Nocardia sp. NPDC050412]|uniref:hypothetical protein n=1 Tax=unclassified Nocardia TaxID=2637762 RepID=UPI003796B092